MAFHRINIGRILLVILFTALAITIASLTIGREIYGATQESLLSFGIINFAGYLFFLVMPVELAYVYYLHSHLSLFLLFIIALLTALAAQLIDYFIGYYFSTHIIDRLIGRYRYQKAEDEIRKYGNIAIFLFNLLPLSSPIILLAAGMLRHPIKQALLYSSTGLLLKYLLISILFF